jgi:hypothetical protein
MKRRDFLKTLAAGTAGEGCSDILSNGVNWVGSG